MSFEVKKKSIVLLIIVAVLLLISNIFVEHLGSSKNEPKPTQLSTSEIEKRFYEVLYDYGITHKWVDSKNYDEKGNDSLDSQFHVKIPRSINMPMLISSIKTRFQYSPVNIFSKELEINGNTDLEIYSGGIKKLRALLRFDSDIKRKHVAFSFIISDFPELSNEQQKKLFEVIHPYAVMLKPGKESAKLLDTLSRLEKEYIVLLDGSISDREYALTGKLNRKRLGDAIDKIAKDFDNAASVFVDQSSSLYNSVSYSYIRNQFGQKGIALKPLSMLNELKGTSESDLESLFEFYLKSMNSGERRLFEIKYRNFMKIQKALKKYKQKGHSVIYPSEMLN
jgi:hypothetical protein